MVNPKLRLPKGWAYPTRPVESKDHFPGVGRVIWDPAPAIAPSEWKPELRIVFYLSWLPETPWRQPGLIVAPVPSEYLPAVKAWLAETVAPEAQRWLAAMRNADPEQRSAEDRLWRIPRSVLQRTEST